MSKFTVVQRPGVEFEKEDKQFQVSYSGDATLGEIYDFACEFKAHIFQVLKDREAVEAEAEAKTKEVEDKAKSEPKEA